VKHWLDAVSTPASAAFPQPMMFAAMMMGIPFTQVDIDDLDPWTTLDMDPADPDFAELREEYRPNLKGRWEGWFSVASSEHDRNIRPRLFDYLLDQLYVFQAPDVVDEMVARLQDRASKTHVAEALSTLSTFAKKQRWLKARMTARASRPQEADDDDDDGPPPLLPAESDDDGPPPLMAVDSDSDGPPPLMPAEDILELD